MLMKPHTTDLFQTPLIWKNVGRHSVVIFTYRESTSFSSFILWFGDDESTIRSRRLHGTNCFVR